MKKIIYLLLLPIYLFGNINNENSCSSAKNKDKKPTPKVHNLYLVKKLDKLKLNRQIADMTKENLDFYYEFNLYKAMKNLEYKAKLIEISLAQSWQNSKTGRIDGRSWLDLYEDERRVYRKLYYEFYNSKN